MRSTALSLGFALGAFAFGCELDTSPGQGAEPIESRDGAVGDAALADGAADAAVSDSTPDGGGRDGGDDVRDAGAVASACGAGCPAMTPVCLASKGRCVECADSGDCDDPVLPACNADSHTCVQCGADEDCADGETPRCAADTHACVQCTEDSHCGDPAAPRCDPASRRCVRCLGNDDCGGDAPVCDPDTQACVQCLTSTDCPTTALPECADKTCVRCTSHDACAHRPEATLCDLATSATAGQCLQCTVADESPCGGHVCDPAALVCTDRTLASKHTCEPCIADSECVADHRCIALQFAGAVRANAYCMKRLSTGCARPYASEPIHRQSRSGAAAEDYCGIDEQTTTCEAIGGLLVDAECADGTDAACGREGGLCRSVNGLAHRCTYGCTLAAQCPTGVSCGSGYCGGP